MTGSALLLVFSLAGPAPAFEAGEFFEKEIRPLLVEKCQGCHGEKKASGGLRLVGREALLKGGDTGPAVSPGKPDASLLIRAAEYRGETRMPPRGKLADTDIARLRRWVALGAPWPGSGKAPAPAGDFRISDAHRRWWAFQPLKPADGTIDVFIRAEQRKRGITPAGPADRRTLVRRVTFGLTGLPPTPEEAQAFINDRSPDAYERLVERLLASPAHGERFARHWLDVARYADYHDGDPKARTASCEPLMAWRYRDWVVRSFNADLPFDSFIKHQIAGDVMESPDGAEVYADGLIATTFLTNGSWDRGDADKEKMVSDMVDDNIDTVGKAFLGLTLGCARCHDHKFDPISQKDYYALAGIFYSTRILADIGAKGGEYTLNRIPLVPKAYLDRRASVKRQMDEVMARLAAVVKPGRTDEAARRPLARQHEALRALLPPEPPLAEAAQEGGTAKGLFPKIGDVPLHIRGSYTRLGPVIPRRIPELFGGLDRPRIKDGSGRRELADWVASRDNPLTARVIVNRMWQWHFGTGLVRTPNNFGVMSEPPSHPALLDWLTARFIEDGWSLKSLHRRIVLSEAYRRGGAEAPADPENRWLARFAPRRLEAEAIRDAMLSVAGRLQMTPGGPASADVRMPRRSLYVQTARWDRGNFATLFDAANPDASDERRNVSTVAPQALFLLNNAFTLSLADALAERLTRGTADETARIQRAYRLLYARRATDAEVGVARDLLAVAGKDGWRDLAHVLLLANEFVYLD